MRCTSLSFLIFIISATLLAAQGNEPVIKYAGEDNRLQARWEWAQVKSRQFEGGYWIGYSIRKQMRKNYYVGTFHSRRSDRLPILGQLIYGTYSSIHDEESDDMSVEDAARIALKLKEIDHENKMMEKEAGMLIRFDRQRNMAEFRTMTLDMEVDLRHAPLLWLGKVTEGESAEMIISLFERLPEDEGQEHALMALGFHEHTQAAAEFIARICDEGKTQDIREKAIFWLGQLQDDRWLPKLIAIAENDPDETLRHKAVFAISQIESEKSIETLSALARNDEDAELRRKALFWLAQEAQQKSVPTIVDITYNDESTEMQEYAVFVLAEINDGDTIPLLIDIAKNHPNMEVRKKAIFWLGQSGDPRAIDTITEIAQLK